MKLYIARDQLFNQLYLHTQLPKFNNKVYEGKGVCFEPPVDIAEKFKDLKSEDGVKELTLELVHTEEKKAKIIKKKRTCAWTYVDYHTNTIMCNHPKHLGKCEVEMGNINYYTYCSEEEEK